MQNLSGQSLRQIFPLAYDAQQRPLNLAWAGGLNNPQISPIDWNQDGEPELWIFDRTGGIPLALGRSALGNWEIWPQYTENLPQLSQWALLRDYNGDGLPDLFAHRRDPLTGQVGIGLWRAEIRDSLWHFTPDNQLLQFRLRQNNQPNFSLYVSAIDVPHLGDLDGDGDLDVLTFNLSGGYMEFYRNESQERGWGLDSLRFVLADNCWGRFFESGLGRNISLSPRLDSCAAFPNWSPLRLAQPNLDLGFRHAGSTSLALDIDADGDMDLILGDITYENLTLLYNSRTDTALMFAQDTAFPMVRPVGLDFFPLASLADVDGDGQLDLLVAPNAEFQAENRSLWYYRNRGAAGQAWDLEFVQEDFLIEQMFDWGSHAAPCFLDWDGDGDLDLVVGTEGPYSANGQDQSQLVWLENRGGVFHLSDGGPSFLHQGLARPCPTAGDLNGDGLPDLLLGLRDGTLAYVENLGQGQWAAPLFNYFQIDVGLNAAPSLGDLDGDGDLDLVVGERNGNSNYFENRGHSQSPQFSALADSERFSGIDARGPNAFEGNSAPHLFLWRGAWQFFLGSQAGTVRHFDGVSTQSQAVFRELTPPRPPFQGKQSLIAVADLNQTDTLDVIVGNARGGLAWYRWALTNPSGLNPSPAPTLLAYPLPSPSGWIQLELPPHAPPPQQLRWSNHLGQTWLSPWQNPIYLAPQSGCFFIQALGEANQILAQRQICQP